MTSMTAGFLKSAGEWSRKHRTDIVIASVMILLAVLRLLLSNYRGAVYIGDGPHDERLMLEYSDLAVHFSSETEKTLVKYLSFPWFLDLIGRSGLSLKTGIGICWILAALSASFAVRQIAGKIWSLFTYAFVLFAPQGYIEVGILIYRNMLIAPVFYILIGLMTSVFFLSWKKKKQSDLIWIFLLSCLIALVYPFAFFIKEDSFWMKPLMILFIAGSVMGLLFRSMKSRWGNRVLIVLSILSLFFPVIRLNSESERYIQANEKYFGYNDYTLRTSGEFSEFINRVYAINSDQRNIRVWAPYDALEKAFAASPTLQSDLELRDWVFNSPWTQNGEQPIVGDFLSWVLVTAVYNDSNLGSAAEANSFFKKVNSEIDAAFKNGILQKDNRIQLASSAGGRTMNEILEILPQLGLFIENEIFLKYEIIEPALPVEYNPELSFFEEKLHQQLMLPQDENKQNQMRQDALKGASAAAFLADIYRILNPILLSVGIAAWFVTLILLITKKIKARRMTISVMVAVFVLTGLSLAYSVGIIWFSGFLFYGSDSVTVIMDPLRFYGTGASVMLYLAFLISIPLWRRIIYYCLTKKNKKKKTKSAV